MDSNLASLSALRAQNSPQTAPRTIYPRRGRTPLSPQQKIPMEEQAALFCNCGHAILVAKSELNQLNVQCGLCHSPFQWIQLQLDI